jgi:hypothetical protein
MTNNRASAATATSLSAKQLVKHAWLDRDMSWL